MTTFYKRGPYHWHQEEGSSDLEGTEAFRDQTGDG